MSLHASGRYEELEPVYDESWSGSPTSWEGIQLDSSRCKIEEMIVRLPAWTPINVCHLSGMRYHRCKSSASSEAQGRVDVV